MDPRRIHVGAVDPSLSGFGGLVGFGVFTRGVGVEQALCAGLGDLKTGKAVVYPMVTQARTLIDLFVSGEHRVFALEAAAADPLFVKLAGGVVSSIDTYYRDLARFDDAHLRWLDRYVAEQVVALGRRRRLREAHLDIDTTVETVFGQHEGAVPGYNPRYHGRPSYHPIVARLAEFDAIVGGRLRPGNTTFGGSDKDYVAELIGRARRAVGSACALYVRIDSAGDCTEILDAIDTAGAFYVTKAHMTQDLCVAVARHRTWHTVDRDADGRPTRQVATIEFRRKDWGKTGAPVRVIAVRTTERDRGKQSYLWDDLEMSVQVYLTNDSLSDADDIAWRYDGRAGVEPLIAELKTNWGIGAVPSEDFAANHAALLLKLLSHNLLRRYVVEHVPAIRTWRAAWIRRAIIRVPGRLAHSGRRWTLHLAPRPVMPMLC